MTSSSRVTHLGTPTRRTSPHFFGNFDPVFFLPWVEGCATPDDTRSPEEIAKALAEQRRTGLEAWRIGAPELERHSSKTEVRVITPGSSAGESLHILSSLERLPRVGIEGVVGLDRRIAPHARTAATAHD